MSSKWEGSCELWVRAMLRMRGLKGFYARSLGDLLGGLGAVGFVLLLLDSWDNGEEVLPRSDFMYVENEFKDCDLRKLLFMCLLGSYEEKRSVTE
jgi:hypothetical protein